MVTKSRRGLEKHEGKKPLGNLGIAIRVIFVYVFCIL
jgi:hypothetical protein